MERLTPELEQRIQDKIVETVNKINEYFNLELKIPKVYYDAKGTKAGVAKYATMTVHLNKTLLLENVEDMVENTVPHEVCHLGTFYQHFAEGKVGQPKAHGAAWKLMMWVVGASPKTTHNYNMDSIRGVSYKYQCACKEHNVTQKKHLSMLRGAEYKCKECNNLLQAA